METYVKDLRFYLEFNEVFLDVLERDENNFKGITRLNVTSINITLTSK